MAWRDRFRGDRALWWTLLTTGMVALILHFHGHVLAAPDRVLLTGAGDGMKNYFTLLWHANHDSSALHYNGTGYPFGEQVFFTDGHPLLSWFLQAMPFLAPHAAGVLNFLLLFGLLFCAWCLYAVLRQLALAPWAAAVGAFGLTMLQPQLFRMGGHLSLAHAWMIPLLMLLLLRAQASARWLKWSLITGAALLAEFFTHPYMGLMGVLFILGFHAFQLPFGDRWRKLRAWLQPVIMAIAPMLLFLVLLGWGDATLDRPATPQTSDKFATTFMSLIVPTHDPFVTPLRDFIRYEAIDWETWCYLGLSSLLLLVVAGGLQLKRWAVRAERSSIDASGALLGAGSLVLLFAMGIWQDWFGEWLPMLAQFRGAGRFAWVFYFACGVFCTARLYHWFFVDGVRKPVAVVVFLVVIGFYAVEGWAYHVDVSKSLGHGPNVFRPENLSSEQASAADLARRSKAYAIIPLPFMHVGSELYQKDAPESTMSAMLPVAYHSGIPLMAGITSRTSLQHTRDLLALRAPSYFAKRLAAELSADATYLLFHSGDPLDPDEQALWDRGSATDNASLRTISAKALFADDRAERQGEYDREKLRMAKLGEWRAAATDSARVLQRELEEGKLTSVVRDYTDLYFAAPGVLDSAMTYEFSFEFHAVEQAALNISLILEHVRSDGSDMHWEPLRNVRSMPVQSSDDRAIATFTFTPRDRDRSYKLFLKGPDDMGQRYTASHILLRPVSVDVWREGTWEGKPTVFLNNVPLAPLSDVQAR